MLPSSLDTPRKVLTPRKLKKYQSDLLSFFTPHLGPALFESVRQGIADGNERCMRLAAEFLGLVKGSGVTVTTNVNNQSNNKTISVGAGFDAIVRQLAEQKKQSFRGVTIDHAPPGIEARP